MNCKEATFATLNFVPTLFAVLTEVTTPANDSKLSTIDYSVNKWGEYAIRLGLRGCLSRTTQVIFLTDDETFMRTKSAVIDDADLGEQLCRVIRTRPLSGTVWTKADDWWAKRDHRLFALGVTAGSGYFAVEGALCEALERKYGLAGLKVPPRAAQIIEELRGTTGATLSPKLWDSKHLS